MELMAQTDRISAALSAESSKLIEELRHDKLELTAKLERFRTDLSEQQGVVARLQEESVHWEEHKRALQKDLERIKAEVIRMKHESEEKELTREKELQEAREKELREQKEREDSVKIESHRLQKWKDQVCTRILIREQESHIADLQTEVESLRVTIADYQQEIDKLRMVCGMSAERNKDHTYDLAAAHHKLLEENARVLAMLEKHPRVETTKIAEKKTTEGLHIRRRFIREGQHCSKGA